MKKYLLSFIIIIFLSGLSFSQTKDKPAKYTWLPQDSWSFSFGFIYPRYISTTLDVTEGLQNFGFYASFQRNFSEHVGLRFRGNYQHLEGHLPSKASVINKVFGLDFDLIYYLAPSEPISPYFGVGIGAFNQDRSGSPSASLNGNQLDYQFNLNFGTEWKIGKDWRIKTELAYHNTASGSFDGVGGTTGGGIVGGKNDSYMSFDFGFLYYFSKGPVSKLNDLYTGITPTIDYDKIESMIKKYAVEPTTIDYDRIEDIVKKYQSANVGDKWYLVGVNFDFNKSTLKPESIPILYNAAEILLTHPELDVEIHGYTDNVGAKNYNMLLSQRRAETVRNFLIAKGVSANRLTAIGYGEANPVMDNKTATGRAFNRRIEFKLK